MAIREESVRGVNTSASRVSFLVSIAALSFASFAEVANQYLGTQFPAEAIGLCGVVYLLMSAIDFARHQYALSVQSRKMEKLDGSRRGSDLGWGVGSVGKGAVANLEHCDREEGVSICSGLGVVRIEE